MSSVVVVQVRRPTSGDRTVVQSRTGVSEMPLTFSVILTDQAVESSTLARPSCTERVKRNVMGWNPPGCDDRRDAGSVPIQRPVCYRPVPPVVGSGDGVGAMDLRVLGPLEVVGGDGRPIAV